MAAEQQVSEVDGGAAAERGKECCLMVATSSSRCRRVFCSHSILQSGFLVLLLVSVMSLASAVDHPRRFQTQHHPHPQRRQQQQQQQQHARHARSVRSAALHWEQFRFVPAKLAQPMAQCETGCLSRTLLLEGGSRQPFQCDRACKECRNASCRRDGDYDSCLERCNTTTSLSSSRCAEMCDVIHGTAAPDASSVELPAHPLSGPYLVLNQSLALQWMFWMGLGRVDEDDVVEMASVEAVSYVVRRIELKWNPRSGRVEETVVGQTLTTVSTIPTKRLFRQKRFVQGEPVCYKFDVSTVNKHGSRGAMRNNIIYHPSQFGLEVSSTQPCWQRLCTAGHTAAEGDSSPPPDLQLRITDKTWSWGKTVWTFKISWKSMATARCHRVLLSTPAADRERCGGDEEILLLKSDSSIELTNLVEQCDFRIVLIDLPSGTNSSLEFRTESRNVVRQARAVTIEDLRFDTSPSRHSSDKIYLTTNVTWMQPYDMKTLRGFCLQLFQTTGGEIPHPRPTYMQCRSSKIEPVFVKDAVYAKAIVRLEADRKYELEVSTMVSDSFSTISTSIFFSTPKLQPSDIRLLSLNTSSAVVAWKFNPVPRLARQGGKLRLVWLEIPQDSLLATEISETSDDSGYSVSEPKAKSRVIAQVVRKSLEDSRAIRPSSSLTFLSDWSLLEEYITKHVSHSGLEKIDLHDKETYSFELSDLKAGSTYAAVVFGPAADGEPGLASPQLIINTDGRHGNGGGRDTTPNDGSDDGKLSGSGGSFWTRGHVASVVVPAAGAVLILLVLVMVLVVVYLCKQRRRRPTTLLVRKRTNSAVIGSRPGPGHVVSRPATWIAHDANAVPMVHYRVEDHSTSDVTTTTNSCGGADTDESTVAYSPFSALSSPSHPPRRVSSFSGLGSPGHARLQAAVATTVLSASDHDGPSIELRRAPSGRSCVHAVEFSAVRPGSPHHASAIASPEKNIFLSTIYGDSVFQRDPLCRSKSSMAAFGGSCANTGAPRPVLPTMSPPAKAFTAAIDPSRLCATTTSTTCYTPRVSTCTISVSNESALASCTISVSNESALASFRSPGAAVS